MDEGMGQPKSARKERPLAAGLALIAVLAATSIAAAQGQQPAASPFPPPPPPGQTGVFGAPPAAAPPPSQASPFPAAPQQQSVFPQGGGGGGGGGAPSAFGAPAQPQMPPQCQGFPKLRDDARQKAEKVGEISKRKGDRKEMCGAVTRFAEAETKVVKFLEDNKTVCGVPPQAIEQAKQSHAGTVKFRDTVCAEGPKPKVPTLSDAIPTTPVDTSKNTKTGPGTFDTLTGNPLKR
jgi:hypothetical protein